MSAKKDLLTANHLDHPRVYVRTAPSLRVPVTTKNRELLRKMRAAEMSAWRNADARPRRSFRIRLKNFSCEPLFHPRIKGV